MNRRKMHRKAELDVSQNSLDAYKKLKKDGKLGDEQAYVYEKLKMYGPCTGRELYRKIAKQEVQELALQYSYVAEGSITVQQPEVIQLDGTTIGKGPERIRKRLPELADDHGVVERKTSRKCMVTERKATVWGVVGNNGSN